MPGLSAVFRMGVSFALISTNCTDLRAQDLEPRIYANTPKGMNAVAAVYAYVNGNVVTDPSLPVEDFKISSHNIGLAYVRTFGFFKKLSRVQISLPYTMMNGNLKINGKDTSGARNGFNDMRIRLSVNVIGSPALDKKDFRFFQQKTIFGVSLVTSVPTGLYYPEKRINLGAHRWGFKPEIGLSHRSKRFYIEGYTGVWFYTNNNQFLSNKTLEQNPVFSIQAHASYYFKNQMWVGINGNWFDGGQTTVDEVPAGDLKDNWRFGATWSVPLGKFHSLKLQYHTGAFTKSGLDYDMISVSYQYIFF
ncbi:transporter [Pollutibacter soli]|uniref:transporter n=1 Tax=Pollutibacter soli TaxID=3034157 RepID=UPI0030136848